MQLPATLQKQKMENMKRDKISITLVKNTSAVILAMQLILGQALGAARDENLPPGKHMDAVGWIQVPLADPFHLVVCSTGVQKELKITKEQLSQFRDMEPLFRSELRELSYSRDQQSESHIQRHIKAAREGMGRVLGPDQLKRLRQLLLQLHGPCSVMNDPKLAALLKITDQQAKAINSILRALAVESEQIYSKQQKNHRPTAESSISNVAAKQKQMQQLLHTLNEKVFDLFSAEQKRIYKNAEGKPFEFKLEDEPACLNSNQ